MRDNSPPARSPTPPAFSSVFCTQSRRKTSSSVVFDSDHSSTYFFSSPFSRSSKKICGGVTGKEDRDQTSSNCVASSCWPSGGRRDGQGQKKAGQKGGAEK